MRERHDETASPLNVLLLLGNDLVGEVPCQQQDIVGLGPHKFVHIENRQRDTRHVKPLLVGASVDDEIEAFGADAEGVEQRASLCCRTVGGDGSAAPAKLVQLLPQFLSELGDSVTEVGVS